MFRVSTGSCCGPPFHHMRVSAGTGFLGEDEPALRETCQATEDDNRCSRLVFGRIDSPISWLAIISSALTIAE